MSKPFIIESGIARGTLKRGLEIAGKLETKFELREYTVADLLDAEGETHVTAVLGFNAQLMARQLVSLGDFKGPFTLNMIKRLAPVDWRLLRAAQQELESLGEDEAAASAGS